MFGVPTDRRSAPSAGLGGNREGSVAGYEGRASVYTQVAQAATYLTVSTQGVGLSVLACRSRA